MNDIVNWTEEKRAAFLYRIVAECEADTPREKLFLGLAGEAETQAAIWEKKVRDAGASGDHAVLVLTGIAGLVAGAFSMAAGEYVSVRSQREMYEYQIGLERDELAQYPEEEAHELALIYEARGIAPSDALDMAQKILSDPERALDMLAREELGLNPENLGSPWGAALFSFVSFAVLKFRIER